MLQARVQQSGVDAVQRRADLEAAGVQGEMLRRLVAYALPRMPHGWTP